MSDRAINRLYGSKKRLLVLLHFHFVQDFLALATNIFANGLQQFYPIWDTVSTVLQAVELLISEGSPVATDFYSSDVVVVINLIIVTLLMVVTTMCW